MITEDMQTRDRILATSFSLFLERGYENTPVQAIIDAVGIAKGTFYHHFKGKEEMLVDLIQGMSRRVVDVIAPIVDDPALDAREKMLAFSQAALTQKAADSGPETVLLVRQMRSKANRLLADSINEIASQWILPLYTRVIRQGVDEGLFRVADPALASELAFGAILSMKDRIADLFIDLERRDPRTLDRLMEVYRAIEQAIERILGAPEGSLPIYTSLDIRGYLTPLFPGGNS